MTKTKATIALLFACLLLAATAAGAGAELKPVTLEGSIACAKCTLGQSDATDCQNVLVVKGGKGEEPTYYYIVGNNVAEEYGHVCQGEKAAIVTGTVEEKDGKMWLTATKMQAPKKA